MIQIESNGSKWTGEAPDPIEKLYERLATHVLHPSFEKYGDFCTSNHDGSLNFFGNFWNISHVFNITTDERQVIDRLSVLIRANKASAAYQTARKEYLEHEIKRKNTRGY